jgi:import receptor subunit TOM20
LKVYPAPAELVMVFQKTIPSEVFTVVMGMLSKDVSQSRTLEAIVQICIIFSD